ncbi:MAG: S1-like domain-containing RNA-binding protein [Saprospiraceae bacterium]|nr:S1-like domain-containing RNA-binding protein [Saprospiraceae bacterium]
MAELGKYNRLKINRFVDFGAYVDGGELGEILVPLKYLPKDIEEEDEIDVFVHLDGEERYVATTEDVKAQVGECAYMEITAISEHGAFADWGLVKNLFIPFREQKYKLQVGDGAVVYVYLDEITNRLAGSTKIEHYIGHDSSSFREKERVKILIHRKTPAGFLAIIENSCLGMLYHNEIFQDIEIGDQLAAYIKKIRDDKKVDLTLQEEGHGKVTDFSDVLLQYLEDNKELHLNDKSSPEEIKSQFGVSKKVFKKAVGKLYKEKRILLQDKKVILKP